MSVPVRYIENRLTSGETKHLMETLSGGKNWVKKFRRELPMHGWGLLVALVALVGWLLFKIDRGETETIRKYTSQVNEKTQEAIHVGKNYFKN